MDSADYLDVFITFFENFAVEHFRLLDSFFAIDSWKSWFNFNQSQISKVGEIIE